MITKVDGSAAVALLTSRCAQEVCHVVAGGDMRPGAVISRSISKIARGDQFVQWASENSTVGFSKSYSGHLSFLKIISKLTEITYRLSDLPIGSKVNGIAVDLNFEPVNDAGSQIGGQVANTVFHERSNGI